MAIVCLPDKDGTMMHMDRTTLPFARPGATLRLNGCDLFSVQAVADTERFRRGTSVAPITAFGILRWPLETGQPHMPAVGSLATSEPSRRARPSRAGGYQDRWL
jgi:hypothetical protein